MRLPETGASSSHEHSDKRYGKPIGEKRGLWAGLLAPGEAIPFAFALSVCGGAITYLTLSFEPSGWHMNIIMTVLIGAIFGLSRGLFSSVLRVLVLLICGWALGLCAGTFRAKTVAAPSLLEPLGPVMLEGWVSGVESAAKGVRLRIKPHAIAGLSANRLPQTVRLTHRLDLNVAPGRFVRCWSILRPPPGPSVPGDFDFHRQAWFQGLGAVGYVQGRCRGGVLGAPQTLDGAAALKVASARRQLALYTKQSSGDRAGGFAAALISGDRSFMADEDQEMLRASGLAHLLAISGLHLGIVGGLVYFLFRQGLAFIAPLSLRVPVQKPAALAALVAITIYLVISGGSVSTQRAFIMSAVFFSAILIDRPALSLRSFSMAMIGVVLIAPESVFAPGFQMSFAATGVLIAIYQAWSRRRAGKMAGFWGRGIFAAKSLVVTSVAASLATAPFAVYHFERLAPLGLLANLAAMPVVSLLSVPAAGLAILLAPFGLSHYGLALFGRSLEIVLVIAEWTTRLGQTVDYPIKTMPGPALIAFVAVLIALVLFRRWLRLLCILAGTLAGGVIWVASPVASLYWAASGDVYINTANSNYQIIGFVEGDALGPLRFRYAMPGQTCAEGSCAYQTAQGLNVRLEHAGTENPLCAGSETGALELVLSAGGDFDETSCANHINWGEVQRLGGLEIRVQNGKVLRRHVRKCSARPWRACPENIGS